MTADSNAYFAEVATRWDALRAGYFSGRVREVACAAAAIQPGKTAADIGAGTGFMTEGLLEKGLHVIAVDQSEAMLAVLRRKVAPGATVAYRLAQADQRIPLPDQTVDYAFANMYLHHVEAPKQAIQEMARIVRPGGRLVITDLDEHYFAFLRDEHHDRWMGFNRDHIRNWFVEAGLKNVRVDCVGETCCDTSCDGAIAAQISIFVASGEKQEA
jgi:ubiquinone/menaquinone biosynthesis C-methylase UbiE